MTAPTKDIDEVWGKYRRTRRMAFRDELIHHYLPLVKRVAYRVGSGLPGHVDREDLEANGVTGLIRAVERFDPEKGNAFGTYASWLIKGAMIDAMRRLDWVPRSVHKRAQEVAQVQEKLWNDLGREPSEEEVAAALGISHFEYQQLLVRVRPAIFVPLDGEVLPDQEKSPIEVEEQKGVLRQALERLPNQERKVLAMYYFEGKMLKEIGKRLKLSESRVSQIRSKALETMRELLQKLDEDFSF